MKIPPWLHGRSLRFKMIGFVLVVIVGSLATTGTITVWQTNGLLRTEKVKDVQSVSNLIGCACELPLAVGDVKELKALAEKSKVKLMISAATAAALPTLDVGLSCLAGTEVLTAEGILNGTTNYILTRMHEDGSPYGEALKEAQKMGVAEPDPSLDVEGRDTGNKILLIANEVFQAGLSLKDIAVEGITKVTLQDVRRAKEEGKVIKLIGKVEKKDGRILASVAPMALPANHPLASVRGTEKAISYLTDTMDRVTVSGGKSNPLGAAAALLKDIIRIYSR